VRGGRRRLEPEVPVHLRRPGDLGGPDVPDPAADPPDPLRLLEFVGGPPQFGVGTGRGALTSVAMEDCVDPGGCIVGAIEPPDRVGSS